jgi:H+/Cl- antiporter ClcA
LLFPGYLGPRRSHQSPPLESSETAVRPFKGAPYRRGASTHQHASLPPKPGGSSAAFHFMAKELASSRSARYGACFVNPADNPPVPDPTPPAGPELTDEQANETIASRSFVVLLVLVSVTGIVVSVAAWCFLEGIYQLQREVFVHLPHALGYSSGPPTWWPLPVLAIAGLCVALAIERLPGTGGHIPADGLSTGGPLPVAVDLPGIVLAGLATIGLGLVLGPEAPLIALGSGLGALAIRSARKDTPDQVVAVVAAAGSFAAVSFVFSSPLIAAIILIEATGIGGPRLRIILVPGLLAAGIGSIVSLGIGSITGLSSSAYALAPLSLPAFSSIRVANLGWSVALGIVVAVGAQLAMRGARLIHRPAAKRPFVVLPLVALLIAGLAIGFAQATGKGVDEVLFSGQDQLPGFVTQAGAYSAGALALLLLCKGIAYSLSLGSFRGGPTFPAIFLGAAAGILMSRLPGFPVTAGVAVGMAVGVVSILRLPLTAVVIGTVLTAHTGADLEPLIILGVAAAYVVTLFIATRWPAPTADPSPAPPRAAQRASPPATA